MVKRSLSGKGLSALLPNSGTLPINSELSSSSNGSGLAVGAVAVASVGVTGLAIGLGGVEPICSNTSNSLSPDKIRA